MRGPGFARWMARRSGLPGSVLDRMAQEPGERIFAWAPTTGDVRGHVIGTDRAMVLVGDEVLRLPWDRVIRAAWSEPVLELLVQPEPAGPTRSMRLVMAEAGRVPLVVRDRVTASVVAQHHVALDSEGRGVRLLARKVPMSDQVRWIVLFDTGLDPEDPELRARADTALAQVRMSLGL